MNKCILILLASLFCCCSHENSEKKENKDLAATTVTDTSRVFKWTTELCQNEGAYDPGKYSKAQLKNTYELWFGFHGLETDATVFEQEDLKKLSIEKLNKEYEKQKKYLEETAFVAGAYWEKLRKSMLDELEGSYQLRKITIEAYKDPRVLLNNQFTNYCKQYAEALSSDDSTKLLNTWKKLAEEQKLKNGSPELFMKSFQEKFNSPNKLVYAKIELMAFGWWNCANQHIAHINRDGGMEEEFNKLFTDIKSVCDEP